jgi:hypothetical protein
MTEAALGPSAEGNGAPCTKIAKTTPGVCYFWTETDSRNYTRARSAMVTDDEADTIARGEFPVAYGDEKATRKTDKTFRRCAVYHFYDVHGSPLYYGKAFNPNERHAEHKSNKVVWWDMADHTQTTIDWYKSEAEALTHEREDIERDRPKYNVVHAPLKQKEVIR